MEVPEAKPMIAVGDSQAEGQSTVIQVNQAAHNVPRCPRLP
jgi:hypothetical protein